MGKDNYGYTEYQGGYQPERQAARKPPVVQATAEAVRPVPEGVNIIAGHQRCDTTLRDRYVTHLHDCWATGRISDEEHNKRVKAAQAAEVEKDLAFLLIDLPPLPLTREQEKQIDDAAQAKKAKKNDPDRRFRKWLKSRTGQVFQRVITMLAGALVAVMPPVIIHDLPFRTPVVGPAVILPAAIIGIFTFFWGFFSLLSYLD
jgi:hypothetical protein